jgi:hypothetical protein
MDYAAAVTAQNQELGGLLRDADWPVAACPGRTLRLLLRHAGRGTGGAAGRPVAHDHAEGGDQGGGVQVASEVAEDRPGDRCGAPAGQGPAGDSLATSVFRLVPAYLLTSHHR